MKRLPDNNNDNTTNNKYITNKNMSLLASITDVDVSKTGHYYPLTSMSSNLVGYLNNALIDGKVTQAQVLFNGPLAKFPFNDNAGVFIVDAELEDATFEFDDEWPSITTFSANLNFTNNSMLITGRSGRLAGLDVNGVQAAIDDLGNEQTLVLDTLIKPSPASLIANLISPRRKRKPVSVHSAINSSAVTSSTGAKNASSTPPLPVT